MGSGDVEIRPATPSDLEEVLGLLSAVDLPHDGVKKHFSSFVVMRDEGGRLQGCAGLERHGDVGLLRSVAVSTEIQRSGFGSRLTVAALELAVASGLKEVVLLTTTARDFFASRFGFTEAERGDYEERLAQSPEWNLPRCSSATFLRLGLYARDAHS